VLEPAVQGVERLFPARRLGDNGIAAFQLAQRRGYEGVVAKNSAAPYRAGRSEQYC
jgi:ATP-dependent DNA ligase